jgi:beta-aspartyl-peptidase (threonine type)
MPPLEKAPLIPRKPNSGHKFVLVIHGGAGTMSRTTATPEKEALYKAALKEALKAGYAVLLEGGEAMDAAVEAVRVLEGELVRCADTGTF